jgi:hypothetical protein
MTEHKTMTQTAPWPDCLEAMVDALCHRPRYRASLEDIDRGQGCRGLTLVVHITEPDAYHPEKLRGVVHYFPVPAAAYDHRSWRRWLFEQLRAISLHEDMEHFTIAGEKPYAPSHGPGNDPYLVREIGSELDQRTSFRGDIKTADQPCPDEFSEHD